MSERRESCNLYHNAIRVNFTYNGLFGIFSLAERKEMKKALTEMQTLRAGCSKAQPKIFAPPQTPFPGARDGQNLISWRWSLPLPINPVW